MSFLIDLRERLRALRATLGASRLRLARLPLVEGLVIAATAGLPGLGIAWWGVQLLHRAAPQLPRLNEVGLDGRSVAFLIGCALVSGTLVSLSPVLVAIQSASAPHHHGGGDRTGARRSATTFRSALVTTEFALALPLMLGAGLLFQSFLRLQQVDPGFDTEGLVSVSLVLPVTRYPGYSEIQRFWRGLEQRAIEIPGTLGLGLGSELPPHDVGIINNFNLIDRPVPPGVAEQVTPWLNVTPGFLNALGIPLLEGRIFTETDSGSAPPVVLVSRSWAERYYPGESAVGRQNSPDFLSWK